MKFFLAYSLIFFKIFIFLGFDMQMGTNHFGPFLFTELILPLLKKAAVQGKPKPR